MDTHLNTKRILIFLALAFGIPWTAALVLHLTVGAVNPNSSLAGCLLKGPAIPLLGPDITGLIGGIGYTILALVLLTSRRAFAGGTEASSEGEPAVVGALKA